MWSACIIAFHLRTTTFRTQQSKLPMFLQRNGFKSTAFLECVDEVYRRFGGTCRFHLRSTVSQEERSICQVVTVLVILSKKVYMYICLIPNGFRDRAISLYSTLYTVQTSKRAMSSHELQSALMLKVEFSKMYYTR
jgi:hypothetical protein